MFISSSSPLPEEAMILYFYIYIFIYIYIPAGHGQSPGGGSFYSLDVAPLPSGAMDYYIYYIIIYLYSFYIL